MAGVWSAAVPHMIRTSDGIRAAMAHDTTWRHIRMVALVDGRVVGTSIVRMTHPPKAVVSLAVHPDIRDNGIGSRLLELAEADAQAAGALAIESIASGDGLVFAKRRGFAVTGEHHVACVDPRSVTPPEGGLPDGLELVRCDRLDDVDGLRQTHNLCAPDDPSGLSETYEIREFHERWWDSPDNAPDLSWALVDSLVDGGTVAAFANVEVDRVHRRAWSGMTATHPSYRGRGLATWLKRHTLAGLAGQGITAAWTANDHANAPMLAVNHALGYRPVESTHTVRRSLIR